MGEEPEVETVPGPHVLTDGTTHLPEKVKRVRERMNVKICQEIKKDPLRPIREAPFRLPQSNHPGKGLDPPHPPKRAMPK